jgi:hypothetical protein
VHKKRQSHLTLPFSTLAVCPPTFYVLRPFLRVLQTVDVIHPYFAVVSEVDVAAFEVVFVVLVSVVFEIADVVELQAFVGIVFVFVALIPESVVVVYVYNPERPKFFSCPNNGYSASSSSSVEALNEESVDNSKCDRANYGSDSFLSNMGLRQNRILEHYCNKPTHDHNTVSDTTDLPTDATRNHSRKTGLHLYWEQRKHYWYLVIRLQSAVLRM